MSLSKTSDSSRNKIDNLIEPDLVEQVTMGVNADAIGHILDRLTDLYPNPIEATVRELISNAYDAHQVTGATKPIEISLPTSMAPYFVVRDFGVGMSKDVLTKIYAQYGGSTKSKDFRQIGAYGLGAKAPLAYTAEFFGETTQGGVTIAFKVSREAKGNFTNIVAVTETDKPDGTTITVPAPGRDQAAFAAAVNVYRTYGVDSLISLNGQAATGANWILLDSAVELDPATGLEGRVWVRQELFPEFYTSALMGQWDYSDMVYNLSGWAYRSPRSRENQHYQSGYGRFPQMGYAGHHGSASSLFMVELKPGVVDFSSSRDAITANDRSEALAKRVKSYFLSKSFREDIKTIYQKLPMEDASKIFDGILFQRNHKLRAGKIQETYSGRVIAHLADFRLANGESPADIFEKHSAKVLMPSYSCSSYTDYVAFGSTLDRATVRDYVKAARASFAEGKPTLSLMEFYTDYRSPSNYSSPGRDSVIYVTKVESEGDIQKLHMNVRPKINRLKSHPHVVLTYREEEAIDFHEQLQDLKARGLEFTFRTMAEWIEAAGLDSIATKASAPSKLMELEALLFRAKWRSPKSGQASTMDFNDYSKHKLKLADLKAGKAVLIVADSRKVSQVAMGMRNSDVLPDETPIYALTEASGKLLQALKEYGCKVYAHPTTPKKTKIAKEMFEGTTYSATTDFSILKGLDWDRVVEYTITCLSEEFFTYFRQWLQENKPESKLLPHFLRVEDAIKDDKYKPANKWHSRLYTYYLTLEAHSYSLSELQYGLGEDMGQAVYRLNQVIHSYRHANRNTAERSLNDLISWKMPAGTPGFYRSGQTGILYYYLFHAKESLK